MNNEVRLASEGDVPSVLALLHDELSWPDDERARALWRWKHEQSPFGRSLVLVGVSGDEVVAVRVFMRWLLRGQGGETLCAARAVDTATRPAYRGRGWFRRLTEHGLDVLRGDGVSVLFNTPNAQSGPANRALGWVDQPRPRLWILPARASSVPALLRSRTSAELWPDPTRVGESIGSVLGSGREKFDLGWSSSSRSTERSLSTERSPEFLRWRYGHDALGYRAVVNESRSGLAIVRTRKRGVGVERVLLDSFGDSAAVRLALSDRQSFDYAIALGPRPGFAWIPAPGLGPRLVARSIDGTVPPGDLALTLGDVELF